nr:immunoglobulin light chain junction region [Macaca mulatta]
CQQDYNTPYSF